MIDFWTRPWRIPGVVFHAVRRGVSAGFCPVCARRTLFYATGPWLREQHLCARCRSITRWRALMIVLERDLPGWRTGRVHESSASGPIRRRLARECADYVPTHFLQDVPTGETRAGHRCENLEAQTFADESFDLVISQDVLEHVLDPARAFGEIARTLKPGGAHVFTVPWNADRKTRVRAVREGAKIRHVEEPVYHENPIDAAGSLVATDWGSDMADFILEHSGMTTEAVAVKDPRQGVTIDDMIVFVSRK